MSLFGDQLAEASGLENPAHIRRYDSEAARQLSVLGLHAHDLQTAKAAFTHLTSGDDSREIEAEGLTGVEEALWSGLVVTYCRCFCANARKPFHLTPEGVFGADRDGFECHQWLWNERNKYHAHDLNDRRFAAVAVVLDHDGREFSFQSFSAVVSDTAASHRTVGQLLEHVSRYVAGEISRLTRVVEKELLDLAPSARPAMDPLVVDVAARPRETVRSQKQSDRRRTEPKAKVPKRPGSPTSRSG